MIRAKNALCVHTTIRNSSMGKSPFEFRLSNTWTPNACIFNSNLSCCYCLLQRKISLAHFPKQQHFQGISTVPTTSFSISLIKNFLRAFVSDKNGSTSFVLRSHVEHIINCVTDASNKMNYGKMSPKWEYWICSGHTIRDKISLEPSIWNESEWRRRKTTFVGP